MLPMDDSHRTIKHIPLFKSSYLTAQHIPACKAIHYELKGYLTEEEARLFFDKILAYAKQTNSKNLVADLSEFKGAHMNLAKHVNQVWGRQLAEVGVKRVATKLPVSKFGAFANKIAAGPEIHAHLITREFDSLDEAVRWIYAEEN